MHSSKFVGLLITSGDKVLVGKHSYGPTDARGERFAVPVGTGLLSLDENPMDAAVRFAQRQTFNLVEIDRSRLVGPFYSWNGNRIGWVFWTYALKNEETPERTFLQMVCNTYHGLYLHEKSPDDKQHYQRFTDFEDFAWEPYAIFSPGNGPAAKQTTAWHFSPMIVHALKCVDWTQKPVPTLPALPLLPTQLPPQK